MGDAPVAVFSLPSFDRDRVPEVVASTEVGSAKTRLSGPVVLVPKLNPHIPRVWRLESIPERAFCSPEFYPLEPDSTALEIGFLYYFILSKMTWLAGTVTGSTNSHKRLQREDYLGLEIPIPPLEVQREIVRVLDHFDGAGSGLIEAIEEELKARRLQHSYYRDALLKPAPGCAWLTLREVSLEFARGKSKHRPRNDPRLYGGAYPFIQTGDVRSSGHRITKFSQTYNEVGVAQSKLWPRGTICITIAANIAETGVLDFEACFPDSVIGMIVNPKIASAGYVEYLLQSFQSHLVAQGNGSAQANINLATFEEIRFPFPDLEEQERIAAILDRFDLLVNDIGDDLPAEISARRKQYEHYRDNLLTFKEAAV